jgi:hypothetical protein
MSLLLKIQINTIKHNLKCVSNIFIRSLSEKIKKWNVIDEDELYRLTIADNFVSDSYGNKFWLLLVGSVDFVYLGHGWVSIGLTAQSADELHKFVKKTNLPVINHCLPGYHNFIRAWGNCPQDGDFYKMIIGIIPCSSSFSFQLLSCEYV